MRVRLLVAVVVLLAVGGVWTIRSSEPAHLVVLRFDPRTAREEPAGTSAPRLDALEAAGVRMAWPARSDALEVELGALATRARGSGWTVVVSSSLDVTLGNAAAAKERGEPGPYLVYVNLAAKDREDLSDQVGRAVDGLAPVLAPSKTVFVVVDAGGRGIVAYGPGVMDASDPNEDPGAVLDAVVGWVGL